MKQSVKKILLFGVFDIVHKGHRNLFRQAKECANFLIVSLAREPNIRRLRNGRMPQNSEEERLENMQKEKLVDKCFLGEIKDPFHVIKREKPDIIGLGYDQQHELVEKLEEKLKEMGMEDVEIVRFKAFEPEIYKSSKLRLKI